MPIDYSKVGGTASADTVTDPQKLFQALPAKAKRFAYLRDVQGEVLARWYETRSARDRVIKMNTGGGKTPVGLLILKSCLNEGLGPAVYVCPDHYLCGQVLREAADLGIATTTEPRSHEYQQGKAILVIPVHTLINGQSKFGVAEEGTKLDIGSIVVDDAHACLALTERQFTLSIPREHAGFDRLFALFKDDLRTQSPTGVAEIERSDPRPLIRVPYWAWISKQGSVVDILADYRGDDAVRWQWPLLKEELPLCQCMFTSWQVEIASRCLPINAIPSFVRARRRIYMTATLADDGILVTDFDADADAVKQPITPKTASDLGERMILVPQQINPGITDEQIKAFVAELAKENNVVVIVPSEHRSKFWADVADMTLTAKNMDEGIEALRSKVGHLAVLINKYDGVDLPDNACRILVLDGLPDSRRFIDRREQAVLGASARYRMRQVQRIEQGMGRGIRSNDDYCIVLLMGAQLLAVLYAAGAVQFFSPGTANQLKLSQQVAEQISKKGLSAVKEAIVDVLKREKGWVTAARNALIDVTYPSETPVDPIALAQRLAFDAARKGKYGSAEKALRDAMNAGTLDKFVEGWLLEQIAEAVHPSDPVKSQSVLSGAHDRNSSVLKPLKGVVYRQLDTVGMDQARQAAKFLGETYSDANALVLGINGILDRLIFLPETSEAFEQAMMELGLHLGFVAQRPEKETGIPGLDVLWGIGEREYLLLPCKNGAISETIAKAYADQISGSVNWFTSNYDHTCHATPVMVHPSTVLDAGASAPPDMRVLAHSQLDSLKSAVQTYAIAVKDRLGEPAHIAETLRIQKLLGPQFVNAYTTVPKKQSTSKKQGSSD